MNFHNISIYVIIYISYLLLHYIFIESIPKLIQKHWNETSDCIHEWVIDSNDSFKTGMHLVTKWDIVVDDYAVENYTVNLVWNYIHFCVNFPLRKSFTKGRASAADKLCSKTPLDLTARGLFGPN